MPKRREYYTRISQSEEFLALVSTLILYSLLILAGMDTTSNTLSRMLHLLAEHPAVQTKLRAEIIEAHNGEETMDYELNKLPYLEAVCRETLRLYPPAQVIPRR